MNDKNCPYCDSELTPIYANRNTTLICSNPNCVSNSVDKCPVCGFTDIHQSLTYEHTLMCLCRNIECQTTWFPKNFNK